MNILLQLLLIVVFPIGISVITEFLDRKTKLKKINPIIKQIIIGIVFGGTAILATHYGVEIKDEFGNSYLVNVRDASPLISGLMFGPYAGLISGLIGGIERIFFGGFTQIACSVGTIFAGVVSYFLRRIIFKERPNFIYSGLVALNVEIFHMLLIFLTHMDEIDKAYRVVDNCAILMISGVVIGTMLATVFTGIVSGNYKRVNLKDQSISKKYLRTVAVIVILCFILTSFFTGFVQHKEAYTKINLQIDKETEDIESEVSNNILTICENIRDNLEKIEDRVLTNEDLGYYSEIYGISEIHLINSVGKVIYSTIESDIGFNMNESEQSKVFIEKILDDLDHPSYVQGFTKKGNNDSVEIKYAGVYYSGGILQVGYTRKEFQNSISNICEYRSVGNKGFVAITNQSGELVSTKKGIKDISLKLSDNLTEFSVDGVEYLIKTKEVEGFNITTLYPYEEFAENRNISIYLISFLQVIIYSILFSFIYLLSKKNVTDKIVVINDALNDLSQGKLISKVEVSGTLEFESLSKNINNAVSYLQNKALEEKNRIQKELNFAKSIQLSALPNGDHPFKDNKSFELYATMTPAVEVGGDFYDFYFAGKNKFVITIADVSGKSFPAAMFMMQSKAIIKNLVEKNVHLSDAITMANNELCKANDAGMFLTLFVAAIDLKTGEVTIANAGHNAQLVSNNNQYDYLRLKPGFVLGGIPGFKYEEYSYKLNPGDSFILYTDGITEALNNDHELYGEERLLQYVNSNKHLGAKEICLGIISNVNAFANGAPQADDMTLLAFKYNGYIKRETINLEAKVENIPVVTEFVNEKLHSYNIDKGIVASIDVAIDELFGNICNYGYPNTVGKASVVVEIDEIKNTCSLMFVDQGIKYNPLELDDPDINLPIELRETGGLGVFIVKQSMDEVTYEYKNNCNVLKITKVLNK